MNYIYKNDDGNHIHTVKVYDNGMVGKYTNPTPLSNDQAQAMLRQFKDMLRSSPNATFAELTSGAGNYSEIPNSSSATTSTVVMTTSSTLVPYRVKALVYAPDCMDELVLTPLPLIDMSS